MSLPEGALPLDNGSKTSLPQGWRWVRLGDICEVVSGSTPSTGSPEYWNGRITWVTPADLGQLEGIYIADSARKITQSGYESCGTMMIPPGSVVLSSRAPIGHLAITKTALCTNQGCKSFVPSKEIDSHFLYFALRQAVPRLQELGSGATFAEISKSQLQRFQIPLPPLTEQLHIAALLVDQMTLVEQAYSASRQQLDAAQNLTTAYLRSAFDNEEAKLWPRVQLGKIMRLRKDVVHPRDEPKGAAIFVGLEHIQRASGVRTGSVEIEMSQLTGRKPRFYKGDIVYGYLRPYLNKVWIAEFDGLCSVDQYVYFVDQSKADTEFVAWYMRSPIYLAKAPIDTTPGQLPRIRTEEVSAVEIGLPSIEKQRQVIAELKDKLLAARAIAEASQIQLDEISKLPSALLRQAFSGDALISEGSLPFDEWFENFTNKQAANVLSDERAALLEGWLDDPLFRQAAISAYITNELHTWRTFGRTARQKAEYLAETWVGVSLEGHYLRAPYGPFNPRLAELERLAAQKGWFNTLHRERSGKVMFEYQPGAAVAEGLNVARIILGDLRAKMDHLLVLLQSKTTREVEKIATVFAVWNDFLLDDINPSDDQIVHEVRTNWHETKAKFSPVELHQALDWMRRNHLIPQGVGPHTQPLRKP